MSNRKNQGFIKVICEHCHMVNPVPRNTLDFSRMAGKYEFSTLCITCGSRIDVPLSADEKEEILKEIFSDIF